MVLRGNASLDEQSLGTAGVLELLEDTEFDGFDLTVTGSPVYLKEVNDYLKGGMVRLGLAAIVVMALILGFIFKVRWRLLPLLTVMIGVMWTFSLLGWLGIDLSLVTIAGLPILLGLGIDFAIQVHNRIEEEVIKEQEVHPIGETLANLAPPMIAATFTGVAAFVALRISKVPMIRDFGVLLGVGIVMVVIVGIVVPCIGVGHPRVRAAHHRRPRRHVDRALRRQARQHPHHAGAHPRRARRRAVRRRRAGRGRHADRERPDPVDRSGQRGGEPTSNGSRTRPGSRPRSACSSRPTTCSTNR